MIDSEQLKQHMVKAVEEIRATNPMAGSITNTVTIDFVANAQLAVGGSAAMVYLPDEGEALVAGGGAIYLNMGTLFPIYEQTIPRAAKAAHDAGKPWVLDPVGLGIGSLRTQLVNELKQYKPAIVRGNASEIIALAGLWGLEGEAADLSRVRGVDTTDTVDAAREAERGVVDIETLKHTNEQLISTLDEVKRVQAEGREKRRQAEGELAQIEDELKSKLLEASRD